MAAISPSRPFRAQAVIFDFDDTLANSYPARLSALSRVFAEAGVSRPTAQEVFATLRGGELGVALRLVEAAIRRPGLQLADRYYTAYWSKNEDAISLFPGVRDMLQGLRGRGFSLALVTQKRRVFQLDGRQVGVSQELLQLDIADMFSAVVGFEDVSRPKPDPEPVLAALRQLRAEANRAVMVGDSPADMEAGRSAGCWTCQATWGGPSSDTPTWDGADLLAETPQSLLDMLPLV